MICLIQVLFYLVYVVYFSLFILLYDVMFWCGFRSFGILKYFKQIVIFVNIFVYQIYYLLSIFSGFYVLFIVILMFVVVFIYRY